MGDYFQSWVENHPSTDILHLEGEVDVLSAPIFRARLLPLMGTTRPLVVDFSGLQSLDMNGVHVLEEAYRHASQMGQPVVLVGSVPIVHTILAIVELHQRIPLHHSVGEAIESLGKWGGRERTRICDAHPSTS